MGVADGFLNMYAPLFPESRRKKIPIFLTNDFHVIFPQSIKLFWRTQFERFSFLPFFVSSTFLEGDRKKSVGFFFRVVNFSLWQVFWKTQRSGKERFMKIYSHFRVSENDIWLQCSKVSLRVLFLCVPINWQICYLHSSAHKNSAELESTR